MEEKLPSDQQKAQYRSGSEVGSHLTGLVGLRRRAKEEWGKRRGKGERDRGHDRKKEQDGLEGVRDAQKQ